MVTLIVTYVAAWTAIIAYAAWTSYGAWKMEQHSTGRKLKSAREMQPATVVESAA